MQIEVGKVYCNTFGRQVKIVSSYTGMHNRTFFRGDNGFDFDIRGKVDPDRKSVDDLRSEL